MQHDKDIYPEPDIFKPERFLVDGKLRDVRSVESIVYGFGRYLNILFFPTNLLANNTRSGVFVQVATVLTVQCGLRWCRYCSHSR